MTCLRVSTIRIITRIRVVRPDSGSIPGPIEIYVTIVANLIIAASVTHQVCVGGIELLLKLKNLPLKNRDGTNAAVDGVLEASLGFVGEGVHRIFSLVRHDLVQQLANVAGSEDFVHVGELRGLLGREIRGENASGEAFPPQEFAGCAWRV